MTVVWIDSQEMCPRGHRGAWKIQYRDNGNQSRRCNECEREHWHGTAETTEYMLWYPVADVLAYIRESYTDREVRALCGDQSGLLRRFQEMTNGHKDYVRLDTADKLLVHLDLDLNQLGEPCRKKN